MFRQRIFQVFLNGNKYCNRISCLSLPKVFFFRNVCAVGIVSQNAEEKIKPVRQSIYFRKYIEENSNFKYPVTEIIKLNFTPDGKHECLKLLFELNENKENDSLWQEVFDCLSKEMKNFELEDFLKAIALAGNISKYKERYEIFRNFVSCLDNEILNRRFELDENLEILYILRHTAYLSKSLFHFRFYLKLGRYCSKLHRLQPYQVTQLFYYFGEFTKEMTRLYKFPVLMYFKENLSKFNIEETGIILAALTRSKLISADIEFVEELINKVMTNIENVQSTHLFYISKFLENCARPTYRKVVMNFQEQLIPHLSKFDEASLISALFCNYPYSVNLSFWEKTLERLMLAMDKLSFHNFARIASITTSLKVNGEEFLKLAVEEVQRREISTSNNPEHIISFCRHLALHKIYPKKILDIIFTEDFIDKMLKRSFFGEIHEWRFLNLTLQLEKPEYQCRNLDETKNRKLFTRISYHPPDEKPLLSHFRVRLYLFKILREIYGENKVIKRFILPHFEWGLVLRFDKNLNALPIPEEYINNTKGTIQKPVDDQIWVCVNICELPPEGLCLLKETYVRHLSAVGYLSILVNITEFFSFSEGKKEFVKGKIQEKLEEFLENSKNRSC